MPRFSKALPTVVAENSAAGAEAAAISFVLNATQVMMGGPADFFRALTHPSCKECANVEFMAGTIPAAKQLWVLPLGHMDHMDVETQEMVHLERVLFCLNEPHLVRGGPGEFGELVFDGRGLEYTLEMTYAAGQWQVAWFQDSMVENSAIVY